MSAVKKTKRKMTHVEVSYDSGSDGDVESDEDVETGRSMKSKTRTTQKKHLAKVERDEDEGRDDGEEEEKDEDDEEMTGGGGWADAMASILRKEAPEEGSTVLAKSKDYARAKEEEKKEFMERLKEKQSRKKWENMARVMPKVTEREFERSLQRIATKGVVQLFNAVRKQQKTREDKLKQVGGSQRKRAKVEASLTKGNFLDMLKGAPAPSKVDPASKTNASNISTKKSAEQPSWGVLRDDFMLGAGMKDWDKEEEESDDDGDEEDGLSDSD